MLLRLKKLDFLLTPNGHKSKMKEKKNNKKTL